MSELPVKIEPLVAQIKESVPKFEKWRDRAVAAMAEITEIANDADLNEVNDVLVAVRGTYDGIQERRKEITTPLDELKKQLMSYEKDLDPSSKDSDASRLRNLIGAYNQKKIDEKKRIEEEARLQKEKENHKVDIQKRIEKNLADMVISKVAKVQSYSSEFFDKTTLETFDDRMTNYKKMGSNPKLKVEDYDDCFVVEFNANYITQDEFDKLVLEIQETETHDKWNDSVRKEIMPKFNDWIGRIDERKEELEQYEKAKTNKKQLEKIEESQRKKKLLEEQKRKEELEKMQRDSDDDIAKKTEIDKMQNEFREQAQTQTAEDAGPVKLILKFKDEKPLKAMTEIMHHCFAHPKFPSVKKMDKNKQFVFDEHGFPVHAAWVEPLVNFFLKNCDVNISGVEIKEISKVIVRA
jgi:hypothetical protein